MKHEITLKPIHAFEAFSGGKKIGTFNLESEWHGLAKLSGKQGEMIVTREGGISKIISDILGGKEEEKVNVITASPDIAADILIG